LATVAEYRRRAGAEVTLARRESGKARGEVGVGALRYGARQVVARVRSW
jgi:hypothetical protein